MLCIKNSRINKTRGFINCTILIYLSALRLNILKSSSNAYDFYMYSIKEQKFVFYGRIRFFHNCVVDDF